MSDDDTMTPEERAEYDRMIALATRYSLVHEVLTEYKVERCLGTPVAEACWAALYEWDIA